MRKFSMVLANFPFSDEFWWLKPEQQTDDKKKKDKLKKEIFGKEGYKDPFGRFGRGGALHGKLQGHHHCRYAGMPACRLAGNQRP